jgi:Tol biopolymer transport system component
VTVILGTTTPASPETPTGLFMSPTWSPRDDQIAFYFFPAAETTARWGLGDGIYVINSAGENLRQVIPVSRRDSTAGLSWSPDGQQLLFTSGVNERTQVCVVNQDGTHKDCIKDIPYLDDAAWSPDGRKVAFMASASYNLPWDLYVMDRISDNTIQLTNNNQSHDELLAFDWSPDSRRLAYSTRSSDHPAALMLVDADGTNRQSIDTGSEYVDIAWSPDGHWLMLAHLSSYAYGASLTRRSMP